MSGVYISLKVDKKSTHQLMSLLNDIGLKFHETEEYKPHVTLIYSRKFDKIVNQKYLMHTAKFDRYEIFKSNHGKNVLVMRVKCKALETRFNFLMKTYDLTSDYDEFKPHITLSYCLPDDFDIKKLPKFKHDIVLYDETIEELDPDKFK